MTLRNLIETVSNETSIIIFNPLGVGDNTPEMFTVEAITALDELETAVLRSTVDIIRVIDKYIIEVEI